MWKAKAYNILPRVVREYPTHRWLFLTLTVRNCQITELRQTLQQMNYAWDKLARRKFFPAVGWIRSTEITRGNDGTAHPHFHCLLMVKSSYFTHGYVKQKEWVEMWKSALKVDYDPMVDIKAIRRDCSPAEIIPEVIKYACKGDDLVKDREWFLELSKQTHKLRGISTGGILKKYLKELEDDPKDLVGKDDSSEPDEGHLFFNWQRQSKKYYKESD
jgi:hypothetical protein